MVWCDHCAKSVPGDRLDSGALACNLCGKILENYYYSEETTFIKNAAGQSQASGNIVSSVQSGTSSSRARRLDKARYELMNLKDALGIGDQRDDVIGVAVRYFTLAADQNFTKGRRTELVHSSCLYLACREKDIPFLLIDFSSYLRVCVYQLGSVYLQLCELLYVEVENRILDPSIFIPRFTDRLLKGGHDKAKNVMRTARDIIASMKRDWIQTGRKPSGICGAAIYTAAHSHSIMCSMKDIVDELAERESHETNITTRTNSDKGEVICKHKDSERFGYGLCESCYTDFIKISGGVVGGSDPPAFQRAEKERMEKAARGETERGIEKSEGETVWDAEASGESSNLSELDGDPEVDGSLLNEEEQRFMKETFECVYGPWLKEKAAKEEALKTAREAYNASNANCPEYARNLVEASKASVMKSRKEKRQKRAEEAKNAPPPATAMESVSRMLEKKRLGGLINYDILEELLDTRSPVERSPKRSKKSNEHEDNDEEMSVTF